MAKTKLRVGIIGLGVFGKFLYQHLVPYFDVAGYDAKPLDNVSYGLDIQFEPLQKLAKRAVVIIAVPVQQQAELLKQLAPLINPKALVIDVSSVKTKPVQLMQQHLPASTQIVATHPLFGPQSGRGGLAGLKVVLWPVRVDHDRYNSLKKFLEEELQLVTLERSPEVHDKEMAHVHALTFFIGKTLQAMEVPDLDLKTTTYQHLLDLARTVAGDTDDLFRTVQAENPHAANMRKAFMRHMRQIERDLG